MAADPLSALLLMGIGITDFSLSAPSIPVVKQTIRKVTMEAAREIAKMALSMETGGEIRRYLEKMGKELGV
jgi:phosphotransferase system enzyme I (PtsP)